MITKDKVMEIFCLSDDFRKFFDIMMARYTIRERIEVMLIMILFHDSRHRAFHNFVVNLLSGIAAYCLFPKKPTINIERSIDNQLTLF